ncbi:MAG: LysR family transcriptional regulator [Anaerolineales bacterium]|nr:LysR family transcriptional regulator [Anaerolineales bacterium]
MIDLSRIEVFIHAAENLNFSQTAREMHVTQPSVSHHIKMLEKEIGKPLFFRGNGGLRLTEAGRLLLPWARKLLHESFELKEMMNSLQQTIAGELRIACSTTSGKYILPYLAARFHALHPDVHICILNCNAENVVDDILQERADLGVVSYDACGGKLDCQEFFQDSIILIVPPDHPFATKKSIDPEELLDTPFIVRTAESGTRNVMLAELGKRDISLADMNISLELGNAEAIVKTVEAGFGVSFVSRLAAEWALKCGLVVQVDVQNFDLKRKIFMVRKHFQVPNRVVESFWGFIHDDINKDLLLLPLINTRTVKKSKAE